MGRYFFATTKYTASTTLRLRSSLEQQTRIHVTRSFGKRPKKCSVPQECIVVEIVVEMYQLTSAAGLMSQLVSIGLHANYMYEYTYNYNTWSWQKSINLIHQGGWCGVCVNDAWIEQRHLGPVSRSSLNIPSPYWESLGRQNRNSRSEFSGTTTLA